MPHTASNASVTMPIAVPRTLIIGELLTSHAAVRNTIKKVCNKHRKPHMRKNLARI